MNLSQFEFDRIATQKDAYKEVRKVYHINGVVACFVVYCSSLGYEYSISVGTEMLAAIMYGGMFLSTGSSFQKKGMFSSMPELLDAITKEEVPDQVLALIEQLVSSS